MNDFVLNRQVLGLKASAAYLCSNFPGVPPPPPPFQAGNPPLNFSLYKDLLTDNYFYSTTFSVFLY